MLKKILQPLFEADRLVREYERDQHRKQLYSITIVAIAALLLMTILNVIGQSYKVMLSTLLAAAMLFLCLLVAQKWKSAEFLEFTFLILFLILFPAYIILGSNHGFAMLWLTIIPVVSMLMFDLKKGLFFSVYIVLFTFAVFYTPLSAFVQYDYGKDMRLRFPVMLLVCFLISFYIARITILAKSHMYQALDAAKRANRAKTTFLNNMSHDIRTPMNAIIGFTSLCAKCTDDPERVAGYLDKIATSSDHLLSLINDILDMSRIESGKVQLEEEDVYLPDVLQDLRTIIQSDVASKQLDLSIETLHVKDEMVFCDKLRLNQILLNLMSNAGKYTNPGGTICLSLEQRPCKRKGYAEFVFRVKDTGIGMSREFLKVMFQPFERMHTATVSGIQGTGLGMSITKNLVEMMGGSITVDSKEGKGSEFTVILQFKKSAARVPSDSTGIMEEAQAMEHFDFTGKKILLVEDNALNRESAAEILKEAGFAVDTADDGDVAVEKLKDATEGMYDLVLMDVQMPKLDGYTATREIRTLNNPYVANIPIVAMTANAFEEDRLKSFEVGMNGHLSNPIEIPKLMELLASVLK